MMFKLSDKLKNYEIKKGKDHKYDWQVLGEEVSGYFKQPLYWLFYRYDKISILNAYKVCKEKGIGNIAYLLGILNNERKRNTNDAP